MATLTDHEKVLPASMPPPLAPPDAVAGPGSGSERSPPRPVTPGPFVFVAPPSDAVVLFGGKHLLAWRPADPETGPPRWKVKKGYLELGATAEAITSLETFGDLQLHLDWSAPRPAFGDRGSGGHSSIVLMGGYEIRIIGPYGDPPYLDGQGGVSFCQHPPLVNPIRSRAEWNSLDLVFLRPRFDTRGRVTSLARLTAFFNKILVHYDQHLVVPTRLRRPDASGLLASSHPIELGDQGHRVRFSNIWVRRLE